MAAPWRIHRRLWRRLLLALAVSAALHVALIGLLPEARHEPVGSGTLVGLLRPSQSEPAREAASGGDATSPRGLGKGAAKRGVQPARGVRRDPRLVTFSIGAEPAGTEIALPGEDPGRFASLENLDAAPELRAPIVVRDPRVAGPTAPYAEVRLLALVRNDGTVAAVVPLPDSASDDLRQAATEGVLHARFTPGRQGGRPVDSRVAVVVRFASD